MHAAVSFHNIRHPAEMAEAQINAFLTHLAVKEKCPQPWTFRGSQPGGQALILLGNAYADPHNMP